MARFRVIVRSYNYLSAEVEADAGSTDDQLRELLFELVSLGLADWETDYAETSVTALTAAPEDKPLKPLT